MLSMETGCAFGYRDDGSRLPTLSLGLSSVRLIVNKFESQHTRVIAADALRNRELVKYDPNFEEGYDDHDDSPLYRPRGRVWNRFATSLDLALNRCIPSVSFGNFGVLAVTTGLFAPRMISYLVLYPFCRLVFGTLYPAYASYKAVRTKNLKEYVKWMMYWIVFALFTCTETFTDVFLSWFPFYYEVKIVLVLWLLSPATKGSSILYRKFVHPALCRREQEIDEYIAKAKDQGYHTVLNLGTKGVNYATTVIMQTAIKGGGGLVQQLRKSYSLSDLTECEPCDDRGRDEADDVLTEPRVIRRVPKSGYTPRRSASESNSRAPIYFPEVDVDVRPRPASDVPDFSHIKSTEDISSGYSSADNSASLTRTGSLGASARARSRTTRTTVTTIKRPQAAEESEVIIEEVLDDDNFEYANMPPLVKVPSPLYLSHTDPPFLYQYVGDQVKIVQVLGDFPLSCKSDSKTKKDGIWDQTKPISKDTADNSNVQINEITQVTEKNSVTLTTDIPDHNDNKTFIHKDNKTFADIENPIIDERENVTSDATSNKCPAEHVEKANLKVDDEVSISLESSVSSKINNDSAESDDEASFGTPENSPKSKRKTAKGRYGKSKAPPPPSLDDDTTTKNIKNTYDGAAVEKSGETSEESLIDFVNKLSHKALKETGAVKGLQVINPISENKRRHKSKSPGSISKSNSSGFSKLLQLPGKLAFWTKGEDKSKIDISSSSGDYSRRSSIVDQVSIAEYQSCTDLTKAACDFNYNVSADDQISFKDVEQENESISHDIFEKSDALQKIIEAKLESHPEYKNVTLHDEIPTTSKSTDV